LKVGILKYQGRGARRQSFDHNLDLVVKLANGVVVSVAVATEVGGRRFHLKMLNSKTPHKIYENCGKLKNIGVVP
jgi:hypothetical protein